MWPICDIWGCFRGCTVICLFGHRWARCQVSQLKLCIASTLVYVHCIFECLVSLRMAYYDLRFVWMGWGCIGGFYLSRNTMPGLHVTMGSCMQVHAHMTFTTLLPLHTQRKCQVLRLEVVFDCHSCQWNWSNNKAYLFCTETILLWVNCSPLLFNGNGLQHVARWQPASSVWLNIMVIKWLAHCLALNCYKTPIGVMQLSIEGHFSLLIKPSCYDHY